MSTKKMSEKLLRFKAVWVLVVSILFTLGLLGDAATIKKVDQGEKLYKFGCMVTREVFKTNTCAEFDKLGNLKSECDPKKVIPKSIAKASKWVIEKVNKAVTKYGKSEMKKDKEKGTCKKDCNSRNSGKNFFPPGFDLFPFSGPAFLLAQHKSKDNLWVHPAQFFSHSSSAFPEGCFLKLLEAFL